MLFLYNSDFSIINKNNYIILFSNTVNKYHRKYQYNQIKLSKMFCNAIDAIKINCFEITINNIINIIVLLIKNNCAFSLNVKT